MSGTWADAGLRVVWTDFPSGDPIGNALRADAVAYWKMDETSGTRVDATGGGNDATPVNNPQGEAGKIGNAVRFVSASSQSLSLSDSPDITMNGDTFTIAVWLKLASKPPNTTPVIAERFDTVEGNVDWGLSYIAFTPGEGVSFQAGDNNVVAENFGPLDLNTWYFVLGQYDASISTISVYINNLFSNSAVAEPTPATNNIFVGFGTDDFWLLNGWIDEIGFWKRLLTPEERAYLYNSGNGRSLYP